MNKYQYAIQFETDSASLELVMNLMKSVISCTMAEVQAVNVYQTLKCLDGGDDLPVIPSPF